MIGETIGGRYKIIELLADGGFSKTYMAEDQHRLNSFCVVKQFIQPFEESSASGQRARQLFREEGKRLYELEKHSQIPVLLAYLEADECLVQEFVEGKTLLDELQKQGAFSEQQIWELLIDLLPVFKFIHENDIIHRDIKPDNIIRRESDHKLVLIDFGIAKRLQEQETQSNIPSIQFGVEGYRAPERESSPASDLYSLGAVCIHLLTNLSPVDLYNNYGDDWQDGLWEYSVNGLITNSLEKILKKLLTSKLSRYKSADEVIKDIPSKTTPSDKEISASLANKASFWRCVKTLADHSYAVTSLAISPTGKMLISSGGDCSIKFWDLEQEKFVYSILDFEDSSTESSEEQLVPVSIAISPNGEFLACGFDIVSEGEFKLNHHEKIKLWNLQKLLKSGNGLPFRTIKVKGDAPIVFSPDSQIIASAYCNQINLWIPELLEEKKPQRILLVGMDEQALYDPGYYYNSEPGYYENIKSVAFSPDGKIIAGGIVINSEVDGVLEGEINFWNPYATGKPRTFNEHLGGVKSVAFSPDGKTLASGGNSPDTTIKLWNLKTGKLTRTLEGHLQKVNCIAFSPNGEILASCSDDGRIILWNPRNSKRIQVFSGHTDSINCLAVSPDGRTIISGSSDGKIKIWRCD